MRSAHSFVSRTATRYTGGNVALQEHSHARDRDRLEGALREACVYISITVAEKASRVRLRVVLAISMADRLSRIGHNAHPLEPI